MSLSSRGIGYQRQWLKRNHGVIPMTDGPTKPETGGAR